MRTYLQIAKQECSNYRDDRCMGLDFDPKTGRHFHFRPGGLPCLLATKGCRCTFFETAVMPMDRSALSPLNRQEWEDALKQYRKDSNVVTTKGKRICPECNERELEPHKRYCYVCRDKKRKETHRKVNKCE